MGNTQIIAELTAQAGALVLGERTKDRTGLAHHGLPRPKLPAAGSVGGIAHPPSKAPGPD
ncbi:hypothetical protein ACFY1P_08385 [Streptomyces sp. NPDC001407]|uniref:hypothetical protein n=1 Tax=Streptomyces sp. NPDC001407 TaxID=3364573 RepID=UPI0036D0CF5E